MSTSTSAINRIIQSVANYGVMNEVTSYELDGHQQFLASLHCHTSLLMLSSDIKIAKPGIRTHSIEKVPLAAGLIYSVATPLAKKYIEKPEDQQNPLLTLLSKLTVRIDPVCKVICDNSNKIMVIASCVSYVALTALGFTAIGVTGLAGLFLFAIKRKGYMPAIVDKYLNPISSLARIYTVLITPESLPIKALQLLVYGSALINFLMTQEKVTSLLPAHIRKRAPGRHIVSENHKLSSFSVEAIREKIKNDSSFSVNMSSIHSDSVEQIFPADYHEELEEISPEILFGELEQKIKDRDLSLTEDQQAGLSRLKNGFVDGHVEDQAVQNMQMFRRVMKSLIHSIIRDDKNFDSKAKEIAEIGKQCIGGWVRETSSMLLPKTKDATWAVHHELAVLRGECIKEKLGKMIRESETDEDAKRKYGGSNNIHATNAVQLGLWHSLRPYEAEVARDYKGADLSSIIVNRWQNRLQKGEQLKPLGAFGGMLAEWRCAMAYPGISIRLTNKIRTIYETVVGKYEPSLLVDNICDAISPQYVPAEGDVSSVDTSRKISWDAITGWLCDIDERLSDLQILDPNTYEYNEQFVEKDPANQYRLTKEGVRLLLWDKGVIAPRIKPHQR
ncbi:MAG: hypothetical protein HN411_04465 [Waddliaceae bacterium]|jgi:hypothetical protein|nr:hypothetical protein [Waddliaceae bacterium]MBT3579325.1 hypothetical protein [Waddliaceae bacterium]MBT4445456.1 hypothetical protein [Waddliaceae bacterium]MBT6928730.1 hypothetical protein [Waddliaceae bacterium]MBT7265197.1 hypothetical protein [Waddliaceae bacterium]